MGSLTDFFILRIWVNKILVKIGHKIKGGWEGSKKYKIFIPWKLKFTINLFKKWCEYFIVSPSWVINKITSLYTPRLFDSSGKIQPYFAITCGTFWNNHLNILKWFLTKTKLFYQMLNILLLILFSNSINIDNNPGCRATEK